MEKPITDIPVTEQVASEKKPDIHVIPHIYAKYVDEKCYQVVDSKKTPNKEFIAYLISAIVSRFRKHYPAIGDDFSIKLETSAQVQVLMLTRILCVSALTEGFSNITYGNISQLCEKFHLASIEHDAWTWFAGVLSPQEKCSIFQSTSVPKELIEIAEKIVITEAVALPGCTTASLLGPSAHVGNYSDCAVECILYVVVDAISRLAFDFWSAVVDLDLKTSIRLSNSDISGILRLFNHGRIPAQSQFFVELGQFGNRFEAIKREIKSGNQPLKATRKKKT